VEEIGRLRRSPGRAGADHSQGPHALSTLQKRAVTARRSLAFWLRRAAPLLRQAGLDLDSDVAEPGDPAEPLLIGGRRLRPVGDDGDDGGAVPRADLPKMQA
jgi:hypothetical protein